MKQLISIIFFVSIGSNLVLSQGCIEQELHIHEIDIKTKELEFNIFYENDSIRKVCWWDKNEFNRPVYNDKNTINTQIVIETPYEDLIPKELYIGNKKVVFYGLCD